MNWKNIKYIFQVPLSWFKTIHDKVFKAYGEDFIKVKTDGIEGGMEIGVDADTFSQRVLQITGGGSSGGTVKYVDDIAPDATGNVQLHAARSVNYFLPDPQTGNVELSCVMTINGKGPDANGNILVASGVRSVDHESPDDTGNVQLNAIRTINGRQCDAYYNLSGVVFQVNDSLPDENGKVTIPYGVTSVNGVTPQDEGGAIEIDVGVLKINNQAPDANGNVDGVVFSVNNVEPDANGNVDLSVDLSGVVKSVDGQEPNEHGNVQLSGFVKSVNDNPPDENGNVQLSGLVKSVDGVPADSTGDIPLGAVRSINYYTPDDNGDVFIPIVESVDGIGPDGNGNVSFGLAASKWMKTDSGGHLGTTDDVPVVASPNATGYIYVDNGTVSYLDEEYVDLSSNQIVNGQKNWKDNAYFQSTVLIKDGGSSSDRSTTIDGSTILIRGDTPLISISNNSAGANDAQLIKTTAIGLIVSDPTGIHLDSPANRVSLANSPTAETTDSLAVATVGYCQSRFGKVRTVNNLQPDNNGNINVGTVKSVNSISPDGNGNVNINSVLSNYVTINTAQTITGRKTFSTHLQITNSGQLVRQTSWDDNAGSGNYVYTNWLTKDSKSLAAIIVGQTAVNQHDMYIRTYGTTNSGFRLGTVTNTDSTYQLLEGEPARLYSTGQDSQIASRGYCRLNFARASHTHGNISNDGKITNAGGGINAQYVIVADSNGTLYRRPKSEIAPTNITTANISDWDTATAAFVTNTYLTNTLQSYVTQNEFQNEVDAIYEAIDEAGTVKTVDGHGPDGSGNVSFGLAGNKWVVTNGSGHLTTSNDTPVSLPSGTQGQTTAVDVVTSVTWNNTQLVISSKKLQFTNGVLTNVTNNAATTINTVTY